MCGAAETISRVASIAVAARHVEIHQHDVRMQVERPRDRFLAVGRLARERDAVDGAEQRREPGAERVGVIGDEDAQLLGGHADDRTPGRESGQPPTHDFPVRSGHGSLPAWVGRRGGWLASTPITGGPDAGPLHPYRRHARRPAGAARGDPRAPLQRLGAGPGYAHAHVHGARARLDVHAHPQHQGRQAAVEPAGRRPRVHQPRSPTRPATASARSPSAARRPPALATSSSRRSLASAW